MILTFLKSSSVVGKLCPVKISQLLPSKILLIRQFENSINKFTIGLFKVTGYNDFPALKTPKAECSECFESVTRKKIIKI